MSALETCEPPGETGAALSLPGPEAIASAVEDALEGLDEPAEGPEPGRFKVHDAASADWALAKLVLGARPPGRGAALAERQREAIVAAVARYLGPVDDWEADQAERLGHDEA